MRYGSSNEENPKRYVVQPLSIIIGVVCGVYGSGFMGVKKVSGGTFSTFSSMLVIFLRMDDTKFGNVWYPNHDPSLVLVWIHNASDATFGHRTTLQLPSPALQRLPRFTINYALRTTTRTSPVEA